MLIDKTEILKSEEEKIVPVPAPAGKSAGTAQKDAAAGKPSAKTAVSDKDTAAEKRAAGNI